MAFHPLGFAALLAGVEPLPFAAITVAECLVLAVLGALWMPYNSRGYGPPHTVDLDGFQAHWPRHPGATVEEPAGPAFLFGLCAAIAGVVWIALGLRLNPVLESHETLVLCFMGAVLAAPLGVAQFVASWPIRSVVNLIRRRAVVQVHLQGRQLEVDGVTWQRHADDQVSTDDHAVHLVRGAEHLRIPAAPVPGLWLVQQLDEHPVPHDDGEVPATLQALTDHTEAT
jgi:hypothetical protein